MKSLLPLGMRQLIFPYSLPGSGTPKKCSWQSKVSNSGLSPAVMYHRPYASTNTGVMAASDTLKAAVGSECKMQPCSNVRLRQQQIQKGLDRPSVQWLHPRTAAHTRVTSTAGHF